MKPLGYIAVIIALVACLQPAAGRDRGIGGYNAFKGLGVRYDTSIDEGSFRSFILFADITGAAVSRDDMPGVRFQYTHGFILKTMLPGNSTCQFYVGPGVGCGWVRDEGTEYGFALTTNCTAGWRWMFKGNRMLIDLSFTADLGMHIRKEEGATKLALFKRGIYCAPIPQISLIYRF